MRYNVHQSRNKIGRFLGVLVAAALVATLGLPSAVQAQTPNEDWRDIRQMARLWLRSHVQSILTAALVSAYWVVTFTEPDGTKVGLPSVNTSRQTARPSLASCGSSGIA